MNYFGATINESSTIAAKAGAELRDAVFLGVKYNEKGEAVLCGKGEAAIGVVLPETPAAAAAGDDITVQIKNIGYGRAGGAVSAGAKVAVDADGKFVTAAAGDFIVGIAMSAAAKADALFQIDFCKCGYETAGA